MKFFFDTNLSQHMAKGMSAFGENVTHLKDHFTEDTEDSVWLEFIGINSFILITRDKNLRKNPLEIQTIRKFKVGAFFLGGKNLTKWHLIQQLVRSWPRIKEFSRKTQKPFIYLVNRTGTKMNRII